MQKESKKLKLAKLAIKQVFQLANEQTHISGGEAFGTTHLDKSEVYFTTTPDTIKVELDGEEFEFEYKLK